MPDVREKLVELGHEAYSCDIIECSGGHPEWHIRQDVLEPVGPYCPAGTGRKDRSKYGSAKRGEDAKNRSKTFPGIAKAMAEQWGGNANG